MTGYGGTEVSHVQPQPAPDDPGSLIEDYLYLVPGRPLVDLCDRAAQAADVLGDDDPRYDPLVRALRGAIAEVRCHTSVPSAVTIV